jgi:small subunit ribosomal protein S18
MGKVTRGNSRNSSDLKNKKFRRRKVKKCQLCVKNIDFVDYKDVNFLKEYMNDKGKILPKRINGNCAKHQRFIKDAIKRARQMALVPFTKD